MRRSLSSWVPAEDTLMIFLKDKAKALGVEEGMVSRGEGIDHCWCRSVFRGADGIYVYYSNILVAVTTIITPMWLKSAYRKEPTAEPSQSANTEASNSHIHIRL